MKIAQKSIIDWVLWNQGQGHCSPSEVFPITAVETDWSYNDII